MVTEHFNCEKMDSHLSLPAEQKLSKYNIMSVSQMSMKNGK